MGKATRILKPTYTGTFERRGVMHESRGDEHLLAPSTWAVLRQATRAITQLYPLLFSRAGLPITQFTPLKAVYETDQLAKWQYSKENNITVKTLSRGSEPCARRAGADRGGQRVR